MLRIAFHLNHFSVRGSEVAVFDYAYYNEKLLGNKSVITIQKDFQSKKDYRGEDVHSEEVYEKFKKNFEILTYEKTPQEVISSENTQIFYSLKSGEKDELIIPNIKNVVHCVFTYGKRHAHGDIYIPISPAIVPEELRSITPHVPHIVHKTTPKYTQVEARKVLGIPEESIVFGRHGGEETFNIPFVYSAIKKILEEREDIYFLFLNTNTFLTHKNIIYIENTADESLKHSFIEACDAMIHARNEGESFGLAVAEFSAHNKPVFTFKRKEYSEVHTPQLEQTHHINVLGEKGVYYSSEAELVEKILAFDKKSTLQENYDCYTSIYSPEKVMEIFKREIILTPFSFYNYLFKISRGYEYFLLEKDNVSKTFADSGWEPEVNKSIELLSSPEKTFVDIGANLGYHSVGMAKNYKKVIAIEPNPFISNILRENFRINNISNAVILEVGLTHKRRDLISPLIYRDTINYGELPLQEQQGVSVVGIDYDSLGLTGEVIKIDVSGHELSVLKGMVITLRRDKPFLILPLEDHVCKRNGYTVSAIKNLLFALNYKMISISSSYPADFLCYHIDKTEEIKNKFIRYVQPNVNHPINNSLNLGVTERIIYNSFLRVKLMCNWMNSKDIVQCWSKMSQGESKWNSIQIIEDDIEVDYYVIINKPPPEEKYIPSKSIVFRMEPDTEQAPHWNDWYSDKGEFLYFLDLSTFRNNNEWHLNMSYSELVNTEIKKEKILSTVISELYHMEGHKKRVDFVKYIQEHEQQIDVFGRKNTFNFKDYLGALPYHNKNNAILPYKYTFNAENCSINNYYTEKLIDGILGESLVFYWGCKNIEEFIDPRAYIKLDLDDFEKSKELITQAIKNNEWEKRIPYIRKEKEKILNYYSFYPRVESLILFSKIPIKVINMDRRKDRWDTFVERASAQRIKYTRFPAVDGEEIKITEEIKNIFKFHPKKGEVGCALSHYNIWKKVEQDTLVLEDDIEFRENFIDQLSTLYYYLYTKKVEFDVIWIGFHVNKEVLKLEYNQDIPEEVYEKKKLSSEWITPMEQVESFAPYHYKTPFGYNGGGTFGYLISPSGARKLASGVDIEGFRWPADYHMLLVGKTGFKNYCVNKRLVYSQMYSKGSEVDSDIQKTVYI